MRSTDREADTKRKKKTTTKTGTEGVLQEKTWIIASSVKIRVVCLLLSFVSAMLHVSLDKYWHGASG